MRRLSRQAWVLAAAALLVAATPLAAGAGKPAYGEVFFFSTTDLMLAYSATANAWYPLNLEASEMIRGGDFSGRVVVVATTERILGFSSQTNAWACLEAIPNEEFLLVEARDEVGVVITSKRSLGFSAATGEWAETDLNYKRGGGY